MYVAATCNLAVGLLVWRYARRLALQPSGAPRESANKKDVAHNRGEPFFITAHPSYLRSVLCGRHRLHLLEPRNGLDAPGLIHDRGVLRSSSRMSSAFPDRGGGALYAERLCERRFIAGHSRFVSSEALLLLSGVFYYLSIAATAELHRYYQSLGLLLTHIVVASVSFLLGGVFPILCHYSARAGASVGLAVSRASTSPISSVQQQGQCNSRSFVFMQYTSTSSIILGLSIATLVLGAIVWIYESPHERTIPVLATLAGVLLLVLVHGRVYGSFLEKTPV